jgi:hypothetical protein
VVVELLDHADYLSLVSYPVGRSHVNRYSGYHYSGHIKLTQLLVLNKSEVAPQPRSTPGGLADGRAGGQLPALLNLQSPIADLHSQIQLPLAHKGVRSYDPYVI